MATSKGAKGPLWTPEIGLKAEFTRPVTGRRETVCVDGFEDLLVLLKYPWGPVPEYHVGFYDDWIWGPQRWVAGKGVLNDDSMVLAWSYLPEEHKLVGV